MPGPRVLVLGGKAGIIRKAVDCGLEVVNVQKPSAFDPEVVDLCAQVHLMDYQDLAAVTTLVQALHATAPFVRVFTQTEAAQVVAAHLTGVLGLPGNGVEAVRTLHDKPALRALLNAAGIGPVAVEPVTTEAALRAFVSEHGAAVVKPAMGSGSLGVRKVRSVAEVDAAWAWLTSFGLAGTTRFMAEELLVGREFSVESFSVGGRHAVVAVTGKDTGEGVMELGHVVPAAIDAEEHALLAGFTAQVLDAVGLVDGPAHTEVMLCADGPRVVESHARRGGGRINDLVELTTGLDLELLTYGLALPGAALPELHGTDGAAAVRFLNAEPGRVVDVAGVADARALDGVLEVKVQVEPGDVVRPMNWSEDRCGQVLVRAADSRAAEELARRAAAAIRITTVPHPEESLTLQHLLAEVDEVLDPFAGHDAAAVGA